MAGCRVDTKWSNVNAHRTPTLYPHLQSTIYGIKIGVDQRNHLSDDYTRGVKQITGFVTRGQLYDDCIIIGCEDHNIKIMRSMVY